MRSVEDESTEMKAQIEMHLQARLGSQLSQLRVACRNNGVFLYGNARTYHAKQLAQHLVMAMTDMPVLANEIEVT